MNTERKRLLELQIFASFMFLATILISIILTDNEIKSLSKKSFLSEGNAIKINEFNRTISVIVILIYFYVNYTQYKATPNSRLKLEVMGSILTLLVSIIAIYLAFTQTGLNNITENPGT